MANVLVTGANGFVGSHVVEKLLSDGHQVRALVRKSANLQWLKDFPIEIRYGLLSVANSVKDICEDIDYVMHIAAATKGESEKDFYDANVVSTQNLVNACLAPNIKIKRFVLFSTLAVTGGTQKQECLTESCKCRPLTIYGKTKLEAENIVLDKKNVLPSVILRISAVYGPRDTESLAYFKFLKKGIRPIFGSNSSLCYVQDVVQAAILAMLGDISSGSFYHISDGNSYTLDDIARITEKILARKTIRIRIPIPFLSLYAEIVHHLNPRATVLSKDKIKELIQECWVCSIEKARHELGYNPMYTLEQGMQETIQWYQEHGWI